MRISRGFHQRLKARALALVLSLVLACPPLASGAPPAREAPYNLLIVVGNCLSKKRLPLYGNPGASTPNLDRFARDAYVFNNLVCPVSHTPPVIRELFGAAPFGREFFEKTDWQDQSIPALSAFPIGRSLIDQGYEYFHERLPENADRPFVSFMHFWNLHFPYDLFRRRERQLTGAQRRIYRARLKGIDDIALVNEPVDTEKMPGFLDYQMFGVRRTQIPVNDRQVWDDLLRSLRETGGSPAAVVASGLPDGLRRRLRRLGTAAQLKPGDQRAIVRALNGLIRDPESTIGTVLFGPLTEYSLDGLSIGGRRFNRWDHSFVTDVEKHLYWPAPDPILRLRDGKRLELAAPLSGRQRALLRQLYREALELILPALGSLHPQHLWIALDPSEAQSWKKSPGFESELKLIKDLYDANIADVDRRFGECLERLEGLGVMERTIVVFMGDHGEALMEHDKMEHGHSCYDEDINPPLLIRVPGRLSSMKTVEAQLRTADVLPTALEFMGARAPAPAPGARSGISLAPHLDGGPAPEITVYSRSYSSARSIRRPDGWKLVWEMGTDHRELYNVKSDPGEKSNLAKDFPQITADLEEELNRFLYGE